MSQHNPEIQALAEHYHLELGHLKEIGGQPLLTILRQLHTLTMENKVLREKISEGHASQQRRRDQRGIPASSETIHTSTPKSSDTEGL